MASSHSPTCIHCCDRTFVCLKRLEPGGRHSRQRSVCELFERVQLEGSLESNDLPDSQDQLDLDGLLDRLEGSSNASIGASEDTFVDIDLLSKDTLPEVQAPEDLPISPWQWDVDSGTWQSEGVKRAVHRGRKRISSFHRPCSSNPIATTSPGRQQSRYCDSPRGLHLGGTGWDGNIYIDGEIARPGPYAIPVNEPYFTLSQPSHLPAVLAPWLSLTRLTFAVLSGRTVKQSFASTWPVFRTVLSQMWSFDPVTKSLWGQDFGIVRCSFSVKDFERITALAFVWIGTSEMTSLGLHLCRFSLNRHYRVS